MELQQLRYFQTVARIQHMTQAAEELNITQPALSRTISRLEDDIGVPLFDRSSRQIKLNQFGRVLLEHIERSFEELEEAKRKIRDSAGLERGLVSIAVTNVSILPSLIASFLSEYPNVRFRQYFIQSHILVPQQLQEGGVDFCISNAPIEGHGFSDMQWEPLLTEELLLLVPREPRFVRHESIHLHEVSQENFIILNYGYENITEQLCLEAGFKPNISFEGSDSFVMGEMVSLGLGVSFISELIWRRMADVLKPKLHVLRIVDPVCQRTVGVSRLNGRYLSKAAEAFYHFMKNYFKS